MENGGKMDVHIYKKIKGGIKMPYKFNINDIRNIVSRILPDLLTILREAGWNPHNDCEASDLEALLTQRVSEELSYRLTVTRVELAAKQEDE